MGTVIVQEETTKNPLTLMGKEAGICWNSDVSDNEKNQRRGIDCVISDHGRVMEFPQVYLVIDGYSARVIRELYTHIGGGPTRLQASTRYIQYGDFKYIIPDTIKNSKYENAIKVYEDCMKTISDAVGRLEMEFGIPREDAALLLPFGMETKIVLRTNLRNLADMSHQRMCTRAYWEYRKLFKDISKALSDYSDEWAMLVKHTFMPKCQYFGYCKEGKKSCGKYETTREAQVKKSEMTSLDRNEPSTDTKS